MALVAPRSSQIAQIKVFGIGGGGNNAVNYMIKSSQIQGVEFIAANTDAQALLTSQAETKVQIGEKLTRGLGAGGDPKVGQGAAEESREKIKDLLKGADMVFIAGGMGGGTASGGAAVIGEIAKKELGILTIGVVTKPFMFEGTRRMVIAEEATEKLRENVDTLIVVPNQKLLEIAGSKMTLLESFELADSVLAQGVKGISDLITIPGLINLDFADIKSIMKDAGTAILGVGKGTGEKRSEEAVISAISSPLLDVTIEGARGVLFNITGAPDLTMAEVEAAAETVSQQVGGDANIIFGASIDEESKGVKIIIVATGFDETRKALARLVKPEGQSTFSQLSSKNVSGKQNVTEKEPEETETEKDEEKSKKIKKSLKKKLPFSEKELPEGIEINDEFDIPSFLRKNK